MATTARRTASSGRPAVNSRSDRGRARVAPLRALGRGGGEAQHEAGARRVAVRELERPAHALGQLAADRQAEAEAALRPDRAAAVEALEDVLALVSRDARA